MRRLLGALLAALVLAACGDDEPDGVTYEGALPGTIETAYSESVPVVTVGVEGMDHAFLVDTGAPFTLLDGNTFDMPEGVYRVDDLAMWGISVIDYRVVLTPVFGPGSIL